MICPNPDCGADYSDGIKNVKGGASKRVTIEVLPHYGDSFKITGLRCHSCGYVAEFIQQPTGNPFYKREEISDPKLLYSQSDLWRFLTESRLINKFNKWNSSRKNANSPTKNISTEEETA